jgi:hypothetical protein
MEEAIGVALRAAFDCAACGANAATLWLVLPGESDPPQAVIELGGPPVLDGLMASAVPGACRLIIHGGPAPVVIAPVAREAVAAALGARDPAALFATDPELAPFWCPPCRACYCARHYVAETLDDEGFFDSIRATCPRGHTRMVQD